MTITTEPLQIKWKLLVPWLESQPKDRSFYYAKSRECLLCAFLWETHGIKASVNPSCFRAADDESYNYQPLPREVADAVLNAAVIRDRIGMVSTVTIGSVLARLKPPA